MRHNTTANGFNFHNLLIIDIETVPKVESFEQLSPEAQEHWFYKSQRMLTNEEDLTELAESFHDKAGIYAEFGKIVCIGLGYFTSDTFEEIRLKSIYNDNEVLLLQDFFEIIAKMELLSPIKFCGHNIKEFDLAYICRRAIIHQLQLPTCLQLSSLKPWQNPHLDTLELWRFGDYKHYITLDLLAFTLQVPSSKTDISGKDVAKVYYQDKDLQRISTYCLNDVYTTALIFLKLLQIPYTTIRPIYVP